MSREGGLQAALSPIPPADLAEQWSECGPEILAAVARVLESGRHVLGEEVEGFEREFARYLGASHVIAVANGTDALELALRACGAGPGGEVVLPAYTFFATAEAVVRAGARPVFADVDPGTGNLDPAEVARVATPRTRAVVAVHLYGNPADVDAIAAAAPRGVPVVEDAAQAHGARIGSRRAGTLGAAASFSFYPTKNLAAAGDGGAVSTSDPAIDERVRLLRDHGRAGHYRHTEWGTNSRLDALQAALLRVKLPRLDRWNAGRRRVFSAYVERLGDVPGVEILGARGLPGGTEPVHHLLPLLVDPARRDAVRDLLHERKIGAGVHYPIPLHLQPACRDLGGKPGDFPVSESIARRILTLPCTPSLRVEDVDRIAAAVRDAHACSASSS